MQRRRLIGCSLLFYAGIVSTFYIVLRPIPSTAQIKGDPELLRLTATQYRSNRDTILTWQGEVEVTQKLVGKIRGQQWDYTSFRNITFTYDRVAMKYMFLVTQVKESGIKQGRKITDTDHMVWGGIRTPDGFYEVPEWYVDGKKGSLERPELFLGPHSSESRGDFSPHFDPFWYMSLLQTDTAEWLMGFHENAALESMSHVTVSREKSLVAVVQHKPNIVSIRYVMDLNQGANPVEMSSGDSLVTEEHLRSFELVSNIWLPKTASSKNTNRQTGIVNERKISWVKNSVNVPLAANAFSPEQVMIRQGDRVHDLRSGVEYHFDESTHLTELTGKRPYWPIVVVVVLGIATVVVILATWLIRCRSQKRVAHDGST